MFHFRSNVQDWPQAINRLGTGQWAIKVVDNVQMLAEAKAHNPNIVRILRHYWQNQNPGNTYSESVAIAKEFFASFIDDTYLNGSTAGIPHRTTEYVSEWNEYGWTPSQSPTERDIWNNWAIACLDVWYSTYWPELRTNLIVGDVPIGNDVTYTVAKRVHELTDVAAGKIPRIGYHSYWPVRVGKIPSDEWKWYSGRWTKMDKEFVTRGWRVHWAITEAGPIGYHGDWPNIGLNPEDGWRLPSVHDGNIEAYLEGLLYFMGRWAVWNRDNGNRCLSPNLFDSRGLHQDQWHYFQILQPDLNRIADWASLRFEPQPPNVPEPEPEPEPEPKPFMLTHWPTDYRYITQGFGDNPETYQKYGLPGHDGVDIRAPYGTPIYAAASGTIHQIHLLLRDGWHNYGNHVRMRHPDGYRTIYAHLDSVDSNLVVGGTLDGGNLIGLSNNTGNSFGSHLHFGMKKFPVGQAGWPWNLINPEPFLAAIDAPNTDPIQFIEVAYNTNIRLSPYYKNESLNNRLFTATAGSKFKFLATAEGDEYQGSMLWYKVRVVVAWHNGTKEVPCYLHSLLGKAIR